MKCPLCGCKKFYLKDPDDEYETYGFDCESGEACFDPGIDDSDVPESPATPIFIATPVPGAEITMKYNRY